MRYFLAKATTLAVLALASSACLAGDATRLVTGTSYLGVVFPASRSSGTAYGSTDPDAFWTPTAVDIEELESALPGVLEPAKEDPIIIARDSRKNPKRAAVAGEIAKVVANLRAYRRQYVGFIVNAKKRTLVSCLPPAPEDRRDPFENWQGNFVHVLDGGFWFWRIEFDVETKAFSDFNRNGYA